MSEKLIDELRRGAEGERGYFRLDAAQAQARLAQLTLPDPAHYLLLLIRAGVRLGASRIRIVTAARAIRLAFHGVTLAAGDAERLDAVALGEPAREGMRELGLGVAVARGLGFEVAVVADAEGETGAAVVVRGAIPQRLREGRRGRRDVSILRERCQYVRIPVVLDGEVISRRDAEALCVSPIEITWGERWVSAGFFPADAGAGRLRVLRDGVRVATIPLEAGPLGFVVAVDDPRLRFDLTEANPIRDERFSEMIAAVDRIYRKALGRGDPLGESRRLLEDRALQIYTELATRVAVAQRLLWWVLFPGLSVVVALLFFHVGYGGLGRLPAEPGGALLGLLLVGPVAGALVTLLLWAVLPLGRLLLRDAFPHQAPCLRRVAADLAPRLPPQIEKRLRDGSGQVDVFGKPPRGKWPTLEELQRIRVRAG